MIDEAESRSGPRKLPGGLPRKLAGELQRRRICLAIRGDKLRIAPHLHTSEEDIERFIEGLAACVC